MHFSEPEMSTSVAIYSEVFIFFLKSLFLFGCWQYYQIFIYLHLDCIKDTCTKLVYEDKWVYSNSPQGQKQVKKNILNSRKFTSIACFWWIPEKWANIWKIAPTVGDY